MDATQAAAQAAAASVRTEMIERRITSRTIVDSTTIIFDRLRYHCGDPDLDRVRHLRPLPSSGVGLTHPAGVGTMHPMNPNVIVSVLFWLWYIGAIVSAAAQG